MPVQDWEVPANGSLKLLWRKGTSFPSMNFTVKLRDVFGEPEASGYDTLEYAIAPFGLPPSWVSITGGPTLGTYVEIESTGIELNLTYGITSAANTLSISNHYASIGIYIFGSNGGGPRKIITFQGFVVHLDVFHQDQPFAIPPILNFIHEFQAIQPAFQEMQINAVGNWEITLDLTSLNRIEAEVVSGTLSLSTVTIPPYNIEILRLSGTGSGSVNLRPTQSYLDTLAVSSTPSEIALGNFTSNGNSPSGWFHPQKALRTTVVSPTDISCDVENLYFHAIKTVFEAPSQTIEITADYDFELIVPAWCTVLPPSGTAGVSNILVSVALSDTLPAGTYSGNIAVEYDNGNGIQQFLIPIIYEIEGFVVLPYDPDGFNFTLDNKMVSFYTDLENTFFDVLMNIKAFDFYSNTFNDFIVPLKVPLLRGRQKENIGLKIHRLMKRMSDELNLTDAQQYKVCEVFLQVKELDLDTLEVQREFTLENVKFVAGMQPQLSDGMGILSINTFPMRVTSKSQHFINLLLNNGTHKVEILKNDELIDTRFLNGGEFNVYKDTINFEVLEANQGDVFEYKLYTNDLLTNFVSKKYIIFPDGNNNLKLVWEDEYKLQSTFEFTGEYTLKSDFESKTFKRYRDIVEILENVMTGKETRVILNTGHILKTDQISIESICRSRRAWIVFDEKNIEIIPQTKSITNIDSTNELISFDVEFIINRSINEEVYMF